MNERVLLELRRDVTRENWRIPRRSLLFLPSSFGKGGERRIYLLLKDVVLERSEIPEQDVVPESHRMDRRGRETDGYCE